MYQLSEKRENGARPFIQTSLKIGRPGDKYEQEADAVAERVMRMSESETMQMQPVEEEEEVMQPKLRLQPVEQTKVQMQPGSRNKEKVASPEIVQKLNSTRGSGRTLPEGTNQFMGSALGADFSNVNIHTDSKAVKMNEQLGAKAFTHGNDIYFNQGEFNAESTEGKKLLAHELTHVVQQGYNYSLNGNNHIQLTEENTGTVETSEGISEIEGMVINAPSGESIRERLVTQESLINNQIQSWVEDGVGDLRDGIQEAGNSFSLWFSSQSSEPNTAEFIFSVASAAVGVIGAIFPPAGLASAIIGGLISVGGGPISRQLDPNAEPQDQARQLQQNMIALSGVIDRAFNNYGAQLKVSNQDQWSNIGIAITMDPPCMECALEELHASGVPRINQNYGQRILSDMIYTFLDWKQNHELQNSTFFISSESIEYSLFTEDFRRRLRSRANREAAERLGE